MKRTLLSVMAMFLAVAGAQNTFAQTDATEILTPEKGYEQITAMPENLSDYYYVITEKRSTVHMVTATQNDGPRYKYAVDPATNFDVVWTIEEANGFNGYETGYSLKSLSMETYIHPGGSDSWNVWLTAYDKVNENTQFVFTYNETDGYWTFKNGPNKGEQYLGTWDDVPGAFSSSDARMAANKSGDNIGQYIIYGITKTNFAAYELPKRISELEAMKADLNTGWQERIDALVNEANSAEGNEAKLAAIEKIQAMEAEIASYTERTDVFTTLIGFADELYASSETISSGEDRAAYKQAVDDANTAAESAASLDAMNKAIEDCKKAIADFGPSEGNTFDFNYFTKDLSYRIDGWEKTYNCQNHTHKASTEKNNGEYVVTQDEGFIENWNPDRFAAGMLYYTLNDLPMGTYTISAYTFDSEKSGKVEFFAGTQSMPIDASTNLFSLSKLENVMVDASGMLTFGLNVTEANATNWVGISHIQLVKTGVLNVSDLLASLQEKVVTAKDLVSQAMDALVKEDLNTAVTAAEALDESSSVNEISEAIATIEIAILEAQSSVKEYAKFKTALDDVTAKAAALKDYDTEAYKAAITEKTTAYNDGKLGVIADEILAAYNILADAAKSQKLQAGADYTYAIINNSFEMGDLTGWTLPNGTSANTGVYKKEEQAGSGQDVTGADGDYIFISWWAGHPLTQKIEGLPAGKYKLTLSYVGEAPETSGFYVKTNDQVSEKFTTVEAGKFQDVTVETEVAEDGVLDIRVQASTQAGDYDENSFWYWYKVDNFRLTPVVEAPEPVTVEISIPETGWTTMILPFDAEIPADMKVYECTEVDEEDVLVLETVDAIKANVPYIIEGQTGVYPFSGVDASDGEDGYFAGLLYGVYVDVTAPVGAYVLQTTAEDNLAFCKVEEGSEQTVAANSAYIWLGEGSELPAVYIPGHGVAVDNVEAANVKVDVYTVSGIRVRANVNKADALKGLKGVYILKPVK